MELLVIAGVDIAHIRLVDLTRLADQAKPFYDWVEVRFQTELANEQSLEQTLLTAEPQQIGAALLACYQPQPRTDLPLLFDGVGRTYPHERACYYFFSWLIRDAPQQRLSPLVQRIARATGQPRWKVEVDVLTALIVNYRGNVRTFSWSAIREVIIDRLEGSRRSIKGHEKENVVRLALVVAIQAYFELHESYGLYAGVEVAQGQVIVENETYDVSANLLAADGQVARRILIPIKTRETEGGGHSHLFTRDVSSAIQAIRENNLGDYLVVVIVARNWSQREIDTLRNSVDHLALFDLHPSEFTTFSPVLQEALNAFIANVFDGIVMPRGKGEKF